MEHLNIQYEEFAKVELRIATVLAARPVAGTDKLVALQVSLGSEERQIVAGIRAQYAPESLVGKQIVIVANLEPRTLRGETSHGMLLAASDSSGKLSLLTPDQGIDAGSQVK